MTHTGEILTTITEEVEANATDTLEPATNLAYSLIKAGPLSARAQYKFCVPFVLSDNVSGYKFNIDTPATDFITINGTIVDNTGTVIDTFALLSPADIAGAAPGGQYCLFIDGVISATAAGNFQLLFAQDVADVSPIEIQAGAYLQIVIL